MFGVHLRQWLKETSVTGLTLEALFEYTDANTPTV